MEEKKEIYSYTLRFNKKLERDRQALEKITQFCEATGMTMRDAVLLILSTVDTSALQKNILSFSLTVTTEEQGIKKDSKREGNKKPKGTPVYEEQQEEKEEEKNSGQTKGCFQIPDLKRYLVIFRKIKKSIE